MNVETGEIIEDLTEEQIKNLPDSVVPLKRKPGTDCDKCHGRGHNGKLYKKGKKWLYRPCECTQ